jgi:hypothetical protein
MDAILEEAQIAFPYLNGMQRKNGSPLGGSLNCRTIIQMGWKEMMGSN